MRALPRLWAVLRSGKGSARAAPLAGLLALLLCSGLLCSGLLWPGPGLCATPGGGMALDVFNSVTKSPARRESEGKKFSPSQGGPAAPVKPKAPVVPGAPASGTADPLPQQQGAGSKNLSASPFRQQWLTLNFDGAERRIALTQPKALPQGKGQAVAKAPLLILLHGAGGSALQAMRQTGLAERGAAAGFLVAVPEGLGPEGGQTWNAWTCCGYARDQRVDDVGFLSALISRLRTDFGADPRRVYLAGFSNGAMLASRFVLERPGVVAALAAVAGYLPCDAERPTQALPVLLIHGSRDGVARFAPTQAHPATGRFCEDYPARAQADFWVRGLALSPKAQVQEGKASPVRVEDYFPAKRGEGGLLRFVIVKAGGHAWPGGARERYRYCDAPVSNVDATALVLNFFRRPPAAQPDKGQAQAAPSAAKGQKKSR